MKATKPGKQLITADQRYDVSKKTNTRFCSQVPEIAKDSREKSKLIFTAKMDARARVRWNIENLIILTLSSSKFEDIAWV